MTREHLRALSEAQVRRVIACGGMLVETGGQWRAHRSHDARRKAAGSITPLIANRLRSEGAVLPDPEKPGRLIAGRASLPPPPSNLPVPAPLLQTGHFRRPASLFAGIVRDAACDLGEMTRLKAAAQRFLADIALAAANPKMALRQAPRAPRADPAAALCRLTALEAAIGLRIFRQLESLLVDGASPAVFARETGRTMPEAPAAAIAALRALARAYDLGITPPRG